MKKVFSLFLAFIMLFCFCACNNSSNDDTQVEEKKPEVVYYENSAVPTLDSVLGENEIKGSTEYPIYGPYDTEEEAKVVMNLYVSTLVTVYGFERLDSSVGFKLTKGTDTVQIMGGNYKDKLAVAVFVN